ncbi:T9SS type A sorting domain-containing protein [Bizionia arctica]|uniref:Secretion system C-terminal sorting domain-containing protein n=1 Tax=Bizionia arctica TaxID=1495645 RepID=A0A917LNM3_9FLAO|nr:T9SS type A sorting domain-containing protein [Bizionia arctica]GGG47386.1 hypothetical protein GCM10010976_18500 [Bizionia arctica]
MKKQLLFSLLLIFGLNKIIAQVPISERDALIDLAVSTDVLNWNYYNWDIDNPVSTWNGIVVTNISGNDHVTKIELSHNNLNGTIPASIGDFPHLTYLELSNNNLNGTIPASIGNLPYLTHLSLWNNQLTGVIPPQIGNNTNLISLELDENYFTGTIPLEFANLTMMGNFHVFGNNLEGDVTNIYSSWPNLQILGLSNTLLTGDLDLSNNPELLVLWAENNSLSTINLKNGTNYTVPYYNVNVLNSPNLTCIQVDNEIDANNGNPPYDDWSYDNTIVFSEDCNSLSVSNHFSNNDLFIYPNPTKDQLFILNNFNSSINVEIYNIIGRKIFSFKLHKGMNSIDLSDFNNGVYIVKSIDEFNQVNIKKIVKE